MKKIMIAAVAVMLGIAANAAAVGWSCAGATGYANYGVYVIGMNGVESVEQIVALAKDGKDLGAYQFGSGTVASNGSAITAATTSGKTITFKEGGTTADNSYQAFMVFFDAAKENGSYTSVASTTLANNTTNKTFTFMNQSTNLAANQFEVAPEPTSGLLLLLGVAGLALRRRRA